MGMKLTAKLLRAAEDPQVLVDAASSIIDFLGEGFSTTVYPSKVFINKNVEDFGLCLIGSLFTCSWEGGPTWAFEPEPMLFGSKVLTIEQLKDFEDNMLVLGCHKTKFGSTVLYLHRPKP
jgi:hypothetical protein